MITLSDLIRKGAVGREQTTRELKKGEKVCALGAAYEGLKEAGIIPNDNTK